MELEDIKKDFESISQRLTLILKNIEGEKEEIEILRKNLREQEQSLIKRQEKVEKITSDASDIIELNVGGSFFTTTRSTLTKVSGSTLKDMFSGEKELMKDKEGRVFLDRDPEIFRLVLLYLRNNLQIPPLSAEIRSMFDSELSFFDLGEKQKIFFFK